MKNKNLQLGMITLLYFIVVGLALMSKKPLCIDSTVVEKIDRITYDKKESVFRCNAYKIVAYSDYFEKNKSVLELRIEGLAYFLNKIEPFNRRFSLVFDEKNPIAFFISDNKITIGSSLLEAQGHLERAIIKTWLLDKLPKQVDTGLFSEVTTDFLYFAYAGSFNIEDPLLRIRTHLGDVRWPQVLKSKETYCDSPWKLSEHFGACGSLQSNINLNEQNILNLSLRPLLTSVWIKTFTELSFADQISFVSHFSDYLRSQRVTSEKAIEMLLTENSPLKQGVVNIKRVTDLMYSSTFVQSKNEYRQFYSGLANNLQLAGVSDSFAEAYFDFLFEYPDELSTNSVFFTNLVSAAQKNPQMQIAVKDQNQIWILPSKVSLPIKTFDQIKSQQYIFMACLKLKDINMTQFFNQAEKLLLIKGCDPNKSIDFAALISSGMQSFSRQNKNLAFIQFHLPSFELKAKDLAHVKNFFALVKNRDVAKAEFQTLGWSQIQWFEELQAYRPNAVIEAIELFRPEIN